MSVLAGLGGLCGLGEGGTGVVPGPGAGPVSEGAPGDPGGSGDSRRLSVGLTEVSRGGRSSGGSGDELVVAASSPWIEDCELVGF